MAVKQNNAEGGTDGNTPTTGDTGSGDAWDTVTKGDASVILEYAAASRMHGGLGYRMASRGVSATSFLAHATTAATQLYGRFYFMADDTPAATILIAQFRVSEAGVNIGYIGFNVTTNKLSIRSNNGASVFTFVNALTLGVWYRIEWKVVGSGTPTLCTMQVRLYRGDSMQLIEDSGTQIITASGAAATWGDVRYGVCSAAGANLPSATGYVYFDDTFAFNDAVAAWPGPSITDLGTPVDRRSFIYLRDSV